MTALLTETARDLTIRLSEEFKRPEYQKLKRKAVRTLVPCTDLLAEMMLKGWKYVRDTLEEEGFEAAALARHCEMLLEGIDGALKAYEGLPAMVEASGLSPETVGLNELTSKLPALREARPKVAELFALATRPHRPIDEKRLAESSAALARGEHVTINDEYLHRIQAGEDF